MNWLFTRLNEVHASVPNNVLNCVRVLMVTKCIFPHTLTDLQKSGREGQDHEQGRRAVSIISHFTTFSMSPYIHIYVIRTDGTRFQVSAIYTDKYHWLHIVILVRTHSKQTSGIVL